MTDRLKYLRRPSNIRRKGRADPGASGGTGGLFPVPAGKRGKTRPRMDGALQAEIVRRMGDGENVEEIGRDPRMPEAGTIQRWRRLDPDFAARLAEANAGLADRIFEEFCRRVAEGELPAEVCQTPGMPRLKTFRRWMKRDPVRRGDYEEARAWAVELEYDAMRVLEKKVWDGETPPAVARAVFAQMRWRLNRLDPRARGGRAAPEPPVTVRWADPLPEGDGGYETDGED